MTDDVTAADTSELYRRLCAAFDRGKLLEDAKAAIRELRGRGHTYRAVSEVTGVPVSTLYYWERR